MFKKISLNKILIYFFLIAGAVIMVFPFYWMIISSIKTLDEYRLSVPTLWPQQIRWENGYHHISVLITLLKHLIRHHF